MRLVDFNSEAGRLAIFLGFFLFNAVVAGGIALAIRGLEYHRRGLSDMNPLRCLAVATLTLLLPAALASFARRLW